MMQCNAVKILSIGKKGRKIETPIALQPLRGLAQLISRPLASVSAFSDGWTVCESRRYRNFHIWAI